MLTVSESRSVPLLPNKALSPELPSKKDIRLEAGDYRLQVGKDVAPSDALILNPAQAQPNAASRPQASSLEPQASRLIFSSSPRTESLRRRPWC